MLILFNLSVKDVLKINSTNNVLKIYAHRKSSCYSGSLSQTGNEILTINGISAEQYIMNIGHRMGTTKDTSVQFNNALYYFEKGLNLGRIDFPASDTIVYTFANGMNETINVLFVPSASYSNINTFKINLTNKKKRSEPPKDLFTPSPHPNQRKFDFSYLFDPQSPSKRATPTFQLIEIAADDSIL